MSPTFGKPIIMLLLLSLTLLCSSCGTPAILPPREAINLPGGLSLAWIYDNVVSLGYPLAGGGSNSTFFVYTNSPKRGDLVAIHADTGQVAWRRPLERTERGIQSLALHDNVLLAATTTEPNAYGTSRGDLLWSTHLGFGHVAVVLQVDHDLARVYYGERLIEVSPADGSVLTDMPLGDVLWIQGTSVISQTGDKRRMWATSAISGALLWQSNEPPFLRKEWSIPVLGDTEHLLVSLSDRSNCSLSLLTGRYQWCTDGNYVSNLAIDAGAQIVYALTNSFMLQALDAENGEVLSSIRFSPSSLPDQFANHGYAYSVATSGTHVSVLFGDSWQLFGVNGQPADLPR